MKAQVSKVTQFHMAAIRKFTWGMEDSVTNAQVNLLIDKQSKQIQ